MSQLQEHGPSASAPAGGYRHVAVRKVGGVIGAVVEGIRADGDADPAAFAELRAALLRHRAVFLPGQHGVTDDDQRAFARLFGPLTKPHPTVSGDGVAGAAALRRHHRLGQYRGGLRAPPPGAQGAGGQPAGGCTATATTTPGSAPRSAGPT
jgi:hypothetical protein